MRCLEHRVTVTYDRAGGFGSDECPFCEVDRLKTLIERDRTGLAKALDGIRKEVRARRWIQEGRGSYTYDDDRYREETGHALDAIDAIAMRALGESGRRVDDAFHPDKRERKFGLWWTLIGGGTWVSGDPPNEDGQRFPKTKDAPLCLTRDEAERKALALDSQTHGVYAVRELPAWIVRGVLRGDWGP